VPTHVHVFSFAKQPLGKRMKNGVSVRLLNGKLVYRFRLLHGIPFS